MVFSYYISNLVVVIILTAIIKKKFPPNDNKDPEEGRLEHHISIMNILDIGATQLDKILLFQIAGPIEVAHYTFATIIPEQLRNIIKYIPTLSMPIFSKLSAQTAKAKSLFLTKKLFLITIPIVLVYITLAPLVYRILFPSYTEVIFYSQIFVLILIFDGGISSTVLKAQNQLKSLYWANATSNIVKVILLISLGYIWGIWGIIISRIMSRILGFLITYVLVKKMATR
jgi:O-antigen/teichoic acid export membrane protein